MCPEEERVSVEVGAGDAPPASSSDEAAAEENLDENVGDRPDSPPESDPAAGPGEIDESPNAELSSDNSTNAGEEGTVTPRSLEDTSSEGNIDEPDSGEENLLFSNNSNNSDNSSNEEPEGENLESSLTEDPETLEPDGPDETPEPEAEPEPEAANESSTRGKKRPNNQGPGGSDAKRKKRDGGGDNDGQAPA